MNSVRSRINSFEKASSSQGGMPSPSRPIPSRKTREFTPVAKKKEPVPTPEKERLPEKEKVPSTITPQRQPQASPYRLRNRESRSNSPFYRDMKNVGYGNKTSSKTEDKEIESNKIASTQATTMGEDRPSSFQSQSSTTVTAAESRKSRIRQSHQQILESGSNPVTNLSERRKQRRAFQNQRRALANFRKDNEGDPAVEGTPSSAALPSSVANQFSASPVDQSSTINGVAGGRWSKLSRLQKRPNTINQRQSSRTSNVTGVSDTTTLIRNTATPDISSLTPSKSKPVGTAVPDTKARVIDKMMSATKDRRHQIQEALSPSTPGNNSRNSPRSTRSSQTTSDIGAMNPHQLHASLESPTDDDVTLTSVHRIMEESNSIHKRMSMGNNTPSHHNDIASQTNSYSYEALQTQHHHTPASGNVGPSWKPSRGPITSSNRGTIWKEDEKSDKLGYNGGAAGRVLRMDYSSDYDMDDVSKTDRSRHSTHSVDGPIHSETNDAKDFLSNSRFKNDTYNNHNLHNATLTTKLFDDDDRTFDYGDRDDDSTSYVLRRREVEQRRARIAASSDVNSTILHKEQNNHHMGAASINGNNNGEPRLLSKEEMEHFSMNDSPTLKVSVGVAAAASAGLVLAAPAIMPILVMGIAAGGLGFGYMQIPEEERNKIQAKAEKVMNSVQEKACEASEAMTSSCLTTYEDSGVAEHVPQCISSNIADHLVPNCPTEGTNKSENLGHSNGPAVAVVQQKAGQSTGGANHPEDPSIGPTGPLMEKEAAPMSHNERMRYKKVCCLRNVRIVPIAQIHGLEPVSQPRAWLDIVASANTTNEQKNEAMEEILLLAKDKRRAKIFLDEGILDYIIWTLSRYLEKLEMADKKTEWAFPEITSNEKTAANLAAMCCVTLGKAHCAAIHTEGDLLLMSMYQRGTVPEERQVAQMLHEVPHHARVTKTNDPTIVQPSKEVFAPRELTLSQAEELAKSVKAVADGRL